MKVNKLRFNEYYDIQREYDKLYSLSQNGNNFYKLIEIITSEQNIRLAFRNIKSNKGSKTAGTDNLTIKDISDLPIDNVINRVRDMFNDYQPKSVRRVMIPKENGKERPLGIPTIWDRIFQQCILQVLEPICEAKFHKHSYGFRPNRNCHHAVSRVVSLINLSGYNYCVDIDIKSFFDNVNHSKLIKQIWSIGIRDKRIICIIKKILKSEILGEGIPNKGTPQGGIISPLLSNIVLNELDWWISNQWETFTPQNAKSTGFLQYARKTTNLKPGYIVRYADDFKIMCKTYPEAQRYFYAVKDFIETRLKLQINEEKSGVINLNKSSTNFLGFKIKVIKKGKTRTGKVAKTGISDKAVKKMKRNLNSKIKDIQKSQNKDTVMKYNLAVIGIHNYYRIATNVYNNLDDVNYIITKRIKNRLKNNSKIELFKNINNNSKRFMIGIKDNRKIYSVLDIPLIPLCAIKHRSPMNFSQDICNFTESGRAKIHDNLRAIPHDVLVQVMNAKFYDRSIKYHDNRISLYVAQYGKCYVTGQIIELDRVNCHHKIPIKNGGTDNYNNLVIIDKDVHQLIHSTNLDIINNYLKNLKLNDEQIQKLNELRLLVGNQSITI